MSRDADIRLISCELCHRNPLRPRAYCQCNEEARCLQITSRSLPNQTQNSET